ncbi:MAG: T9SS type A sorting domain-containing protein [Bacteroidota bacterium]
MKKKKILFRLLAIAFAGNIFIMATSENSRHNNYTPRSEKNQKYQTGMNGTVSYLNTLRNNQLTGDFDSKWVIDACKESKTLLKSKTGNALDLTWNEIGPDNYSGRTRAILIDKDNPNKMYAGAAGGGLWKSTTGGSSWTLINDFAENLAISCIAQSSNGTIYVGTGEGMDTTLAIGNANGSTAFIGKGIFISTDGNTFTLIPSTTPTTENSNSAAWAFINKLACDPSNPNRIYAATNRGLRSTDDGGTTWIIPIEQFGVDYTAIATDVDVATDGTVVTSVGNKCFISPNGNDGTFVCQSVSGTSGDLPAGNLIRLELAIAPSNPDYMYASAASKIDTSNIYRSTNKGDSWTIIGPGGSDLFKPLGDEGAFNNTVAVYPNDPNKVLIGGVDMWEWHEGGTWTQKSLYYLSNTSPYYLHEGHNIYVFHPTNPDILFVGSDGGISRSIDGGETFQTMNINYSTVQCYAVTASPNGYIMAGCQDNGTLYLPRTGAFPKHASDIMEGDGGWPTFSYINPEAFFATTNFGGTRRSPDQGANFYPASFGASASNLFFSSRMMQSLVPGDSAFPAAYITPLLMWENFNDIYSYDSIEFTPAIITNEILDKGVTGVTHFSGTLEKDGQPNACIVPGSVHIISGSIEVSDDDGDGNFDGDIDTSCLNKIYYNTIGGFTAGYYDLTFSSAPANGSNILISYETRFDADSTIKIQSNNKPATFWYKTPVDIESEDVVMIQDIVQAHFFVGFNNGIWMTKEALDFAKRPEWFKLANIVPATKQKTQCIAITKDGNYLFAGTSNGNLIRLSNIRAAQDSITADYGTTTTPNINSVVGFSQFNIASNRAITSIAIDPNDPNNLVVTLGNYGNTEYVYYSSNALDSAVTFTSKQGNLPEMPVYTSVIPVFQSGTVLLGTEYGIYSTDDITASLPQWSVENTGLANVPVYMLWQQIYNYYNENCTVTNYGTIYAATHGRGIFECTKYTSIYEPDPGSNSSSNVYMPFSISIYPNPVNNNAFVSFTLPENNDVKVHIYDLSGKLLKSISLAYLTKGAHTYNLDCSILKNGTYFIQVQCGTETASAKFIKMQ